jgi:hypothetical protein
MLTEHLLGRTVIKKLGLRRSAGADYGNDQS